eukprot:14610569-Alexandrium_andersonii.AAC.1
MMRVHCQRRPDRFEVKRTDEANAASAVILEDTPRGRWSLCIQLSKWANGCPLTSIVWGCRHNSEASGAMP